MNPRLIPALALCLFASMASANDTSDGTSMNSSFVFLVTSASTEDAPFQKLVNARDDAISYVASDGAIRGAYLEAALQHLRDDQRLAGHSDMQLAGALLDYTVD